MNDWLHIGTIDDIPAQGARVLETAFGNIALFRTQADEVFALRDRCPHKGGPLSQGLVHGSNSHFGDYALQTHPTRTLKQGPAIIGSSTGDCL